MLGEFALIDRYFARATPSAILGPGDDCALLQPTPGKELAITTDMLVAGTHFLPDTNPKNLGWKALAVNLSDLAAMGAQPRWVTLAGALPVVDELWIAQFAEGFFACAAEYGVDVIGGDTTKGPLNLCVTAMGEVEPGHALRRDGAKVGDQIWVSGRPGLAALGLAQLQGRVELPMHWCRLCVAGAGWCRFRRHRRFRWPARRPRPHRRTFRAGRRRATGTTPALAQGRKLRCRPASPGS